MMDLTGVKLDIRQQGFLNPPDIQVLASAGDLTDLVCVRLDKDARFLEDSGLCYDLNELAETYCPDFWDDVDPCSSSTTRPAIGKSIPCATAILTTTSTQTPVFPLIRPGRSIST